jgi:signal transduction histidine kinase/CheY-like chemotaxis protein/HPt (histidine-containing phosphotransfer) domain-containing protein
MPPVFKSVSLRSLIHWIGLSFALTIAAAGPLAFSYISWLDEIHDLTLRNDINAARVAKYAYTNAKFWRYHRVRLAELIELPERAGHPLRQRIEDLKGNTVVEEGAAPPFPVVRVATPLVVQGETIGQLITESSLMPRSLAFLGVTLFCGLLGFGAYAAIRIVPIRVLDRTLDELHSAQDGLSQTNTTLITLNAQLEERVRLRTKHLLDQQGVLSTLIKSDDQRFGNLNDVASSLTAVTAATLGVERVGVFLADAGQESLKCLHVYDPSDRGPVHEVAFSASKFPNYFQALLADEAISADDAQADVRTSELVETYLKANGVTSALHVPVVRNGRVDGIVAIERVGSAHVWSAEQRLFGLAVANLIALAIERQERMRAEMDLREANKSVLAANQAKSLFLANMSHEIRTPMNGVFGMTDLLMRTELSERQERLVNTINQSAKSLLTIINDILDVSRIEAGKVELDLTDFDLRQCVEDTADLLAETAQNKGLELTLFIAPNVPRCVNGDAGRVRQVFTNILSNAVKFTQAGSVAVVVNCRATSADHATIEIKVRDTGIGISADVQHRLFQSFEQADTSISRRFGGTGLGLAITKHLVGMMGGDITLASEMGTGSEFTITLPLALGEALVSFRTEIPTSLQGQRILVLDDRATNREIIASYLRESGAETTCVETPDQAMRALHDAARQSLPFAIAMIDMVLPGSSGLEVADLIRADGAFANLRMIMVTSLSWKGDAQVARAHGFQEFLTKPVRRKDLFDAATRVLIQSGRVGSPSGQKWTQNQVAVANETPTHRVLVAEDNPVNVEVAKEYLSNLNCAVTLAGTGLEALSAFLQPRFDIILMDCQMPQMDGLAATRRIRETEKALGLPRTTIVAVTANAYQEDRAQCLAAGMDDYLSKPFSEEQLQQMLAKWINRSPSVLADRAVAAAASMEPQTAPNNAANVVSAVRHLDGDVLADLKTRHPALLARLIRAYLVVAPELIAQLTEGAAMINRDVIRTAAHSLKSSSANIGAVHLSALCVDLESVLQFQDGADVTSACITCAKQIETEFSAVSAELEIMTGMLQAAGAVYAAAPIKSGAA